TTSGHLLENSPNFPWVPVVDGDFLIEDTGDVAETRLFHKNGLRAGPTYMAEGNLGSATTTDGKNYSVLKAILHEYEPTKRPVRARDWLDSMEKMLGDYHFTCNVNEMALAHSKHGGDTYYYYFTHRNGWAAYMVMRLILFFGEPFNKKFNYSTEEQELSSRFMRYWANFARTGDPNKNEDGTYTTDVWPKYNGESMEYMNMTVESAYPTSQRTGHGPRREQCAFWKSYLPNLMAKTEDDDC
ncbi:hypothetical protein OSTOST_03326, partial [Ostertagia ostertagi]